MNGLTSYVVGTLISAMILGSYLFSWNLFGFASHRLERIEDRVNEIFTLVGGKK